MAKAGSDNKIKRVILKDKPAEGDGFSGGGHQRTANALAETILELDEGDNAIGLEGSWGSGKSTIVRLASKRLDETEKLHKYRVFTFDLWANQTGHFKRSFLEAFLDWASAQFEDDTKFLDEKRAEIGDRKKTVTTENTPRFSWFGVTAIVFLYFSPIIYAWLTPAAFSDASGNATITLGAKLAWLAILGMTIVLSGAIFFYWPSKGGVLDRLQTAISRAFAIFSKQADKTTIEQNIRDEDPTQFEFTRIFREIVARLQRKHDRIVVVFDNIDRLPDSRIADEWSEVRSAFYGDHSGTAGRTDITAIVPYARAVTLAAVANANAERGGEDAEYLRADLFRKSFDAIFHVAPPILSDTASFFRDKFAEATLGTIDLDTAARVYRIFDLKVQKSGEPTTPRQVIAFINDLTSWWVQWQAEIPIETIAVFVSHQEQLVRDPSALRTEGFIEDRVQRHANQSDLIRDLAALAYNVPPEMALQVLSHDPIRKAILADKPDELIDLAKGAPDNGFSEILPKVIDEQSSEWLEEPLGAFDSVVSNVAKASKAVDGFGYSKRALIANLNSLGMSTLDRVEKAEKIWDAIELAPKTKAAAVTSTLASWVGKHLPSGDKQNASHGRKWIKTIGKLLDKLASEHGDETRVVVQKKIELPATVKGIIGAAIDCDEAEYHIKDFRAPTATPKLIAEGLLDYAAEDALFIYAWAELSYLLTDTEKETILGTTVDHLKDNAIDVTTKEFGYSARNLRDVCLTVSNTNRPKSAKIKEFFETGAAIHYAHTLSQEDPEKNADHIATIFWLCMDHFGGSEPAVANPQGVPVFGNIQEAFNWFASELQSTEFSQSRARSIAQHVLTTSRVGFFVKNAAKEDGREHRFSSVVSQLAKQENFHPPALSIVIDHFSVLKELLGDDIEILLNAVGKKSNDDYWKSIPFSKLPNELVEAAAEQEGAGWKKLLGSLDDWLRGFKDEDWQKAITTNSPAIRLLGRRREQAEVTIPAASLYEPLIENALAVIKGDHDSSISPTEYGNLIESLPENTGKKLPSDFFKRHRAHSSGIGQAVSLYPELLKTLPFASEPEHTVETYILPLLREGSAEADAFITDSSATFQEVMKIADDTASGAVSEFIEGLAEDKDSTERLAGLRRALGVKPKGEKSEQPDKPE